jgi:hypothetical protein
MAGITDLVNAELTSFAVSLATYHNSIKGPWEVIDINSVRFYHVKGFGKTSASLEVTDMVFGDEDGQIIAATYLGGDQNDFSNAAVWDKSAIAG